jgi:hypothetical protein
MMINFRTMICAGGFALLMAGPALAEGDKANGGNGNHYGWDKGGSGGGVSHSAPGPESFESRRGRLRFYRVPAAYAGRHASGWRRLASRDQV